MIVFDANVISEIFRHRPHARVVAWLESLAGDVAITEKTAFRAAAGGDGELMPAAWYFATVDEVTKKRMAEIVR